MKGVSEQGILQLRFQQQLNIRHRVEDN